MTLPRSFLRAGWTHALSLLRGGENKLPLPLRPVLLCACAMRCFCPIPVVPPLIIVWKSWAGFEAYVIARLPQLERLDGKEITRTARIKAQQRLPALRREIVPLAGEVGVNSGSPFAPAYQTRRFSLPPLNILGWTVPSGSLALLSVSISPAEVVVHTAVFVHLILLCLGLSLERKYLFSCVLHVRSPHLSA